MSEKLKALTEKIYEEGIEKAKSDSNQIIEDAKKKASKILQEAEAKKSQMLTEAEFEIESLKKKVGSEIKMAAQKSINQIKQQLIEIIQEKTISHPISKTFNDPKFCATAIIQCLASLKNNSEGSWVFDVPRKEKEEIEQAINNQKSSLLSSGISINPSPNLKSGFEVMPENGNYILKFDEAMFEEYFSSFLKLETKNLIQ